MSIQGCLSRVSIQGCISRGVYPEVAIQGVYREVFIQRCLSRGVYPGCLSRGVHPGVSIPGVLWLLLLILNFELRVQAVLPLLIIHFRYYSQDNPRQKPLRIATWLIEIVIGEHDTTVLEGQEQILYVQVRPSEGCQLGCNNCTVLCR